jgi:hypothetical protein
LNAFPPEDHEGPETPGDKSVAVLDPIEDLTDLRVVIEDDVDYSEVVPNSSPGDQQKLNAIVELAKRLEELTRWSRNELLDRIGCEHRDPSRLAHDPDKLDRCTRFLQLILDAARLVDTVQDHRRVVQSCARLSKATQRDADGLRELLRSGEFSPLDYVSIGEISSAVRTARIAAEKDQAGTQVGPSPYDAAPTVHLSVPRVDLYARGEQAVLGEKTFRRITEHVASCPACQEAVEFRQARLQPH